MTERYGSIEIVGHDKERISNTYATVDDRKTDKVVLVFPGEGYKCTMPLLYYPSKLLFEKGYDLIWLEYDYKSKRQWDSLTDDQQIAWMTFDAAAAYAAVLKKAHYKEIVLIGKSLGSFHLTALSNLYPGIKHNIWMTPPWESNFVYPTMKKFWKNSLYVAGTADPYYSKARADEIEKLGGSTLVIEGVDHAMEEKDSHKSLEVLERIIRWIDSLVK